jgi:hypothetical protein
VACFSIEGSRLAEHYFVKTDILHHDPDNGQTAHLCRESINLIGAMSDIAEKAFDGALVVFLNILYNIPLWEGSPLHTIRHGIKNKASC